MAKQGRLAPEIVQKIRSNVTITTFGFYGQFPTNILEKVRTGFIRDQDAACAGDQYRQPLDWLTDRISVIDRILEDREAERPRTSEEKAWGKIENGTVKPIRFKCGVKR